MSGLLARLTGRRKESTPPDYEEAKHLASDQSPKARRSLAARGDVQPEILYFLADDPDVDVRRAVAGNDATPMCAVILRNASAVWRHSWTRLRATVSGPP